MLKISPGVKIQPPDGYLLAVTVDTLISGVHFPVNTNPEDVGHKALAVNLSDLAAMGALPKWITVTLVLPELFKERIHTEDTSWLESFEKGLMKLAEQYKVQLVSVDYKTGPLTITINAIGIVEEGAAILRSGAKTGDLVYVTGTLGDAGLALEYLDKDKPIPEQYQITLLNRFNRPAPRIETGLALKGIANACIDISDGLIADLGHICEASGTGATVYTDKLPLSEAIMAVTSEEDAIQFALSSGDDYELCFTVPEDKRGRLIEVFTRLDVGCSCIGKIESEAGMRIVDTKGEGVQIDKSGYQHFHDSTSLL